MIMKQFDLTTGQITAHKYDGEEQNQIVRTQLLSDKRIMKMAGNCRTKTSHNQNILLAQAFKTAIEFPESENCNSNRFTNLYKNLIRDIQIFFKLKFKQFKDKSDFLKSVQFMNLDIKYALLPAMIRLFIIDFFDLRMIDDDKMSLLVFTLAAFIAPKQVMKSFEISKQTVLESVYILKISDFYKN